MKKSVVIIIMIMLTSCTSAILDKTIGAGIELLSYGSNPEQKKEEIEVQFPVTEIKIQKLKWYEFYKKYEDKTISSDAYDISVSFDKKDIYILINVHPTYIKGMRFPHNPLSIKLDFPLINKKYYEYDLSGNPFEVQLINTESYYIIRIQKQSITVEA